MKKPIKRTFRIFRNIITVRPLRKYIERKIKIKNIKKLSYP